MKREQYYEITLTHFSEYRVLVHAVSRSEAATKAQKHFDYSSDGPVKEFEKVTKVRCLGTAEKTKKR